MDQSSGNNALAIGAASFASIGKDIADSAGRQATPKNENDKETIWQYKLPWTDGWVDYHRFQEMDINTYQPYEKFKEWVESQGGEVRIKE